VTDRSERFGRTDWERVIGLSVLAFLILFSYAIARPTTESLFLEAHGSEELPWVWALVAGTALVVVAIYNRVVPGRELVGLFGAAALLSGLLLVGLQGARAVGAPGVHHALYVWKDVYVVVLVEIYYTFANSVFPIRTARWAYGWFGMVGAFGGMVGNLAVGGLATRYGTASALWLVLPLLAAMWGVCVVLARRAGHRGTADEERPGVLAGLGVVWRSEYLVLVLLLIGVVQVAITLVDLQFNTVVEQVHPDTDQRTAVIGQVYAAISAGTIVLHALTCPVLRLAGVPLTLLGIPGVLGVAVGGFAAAPAFFTVAVAKVASKCLDYTLFRAAKEILYIPLGYREKTEGKAVVDMLTYRVAKGGVALLLVALASVRTVGLVNSLTTGALVVWIGLTAVIISRFRARVSREEEMRAA